MNGGADAVSHHRDNLSNPAWLLRFAVAMMPLVWLVALRYLPWITVDGSLASVYLVLVYVGHLSLLPLLTLLPLLLLARLPVRLFRSIAMTVMMLMLGLLVIDTLVYKLYRFHINAMVLEMVLLSGTDTFEVSATVYLVLLAGFAAVLMLLVLVAGWLVPRIGRRVVAAALLSVAVCLPVVHGMHAWADASYDGRITGIGRQITGKLFMVPSRRRSWSIELLRWAISR